MARLPTIENMGTRPAPRPQGRVIPFRADIAQEAEAAGFRQTAKDIGTISTAGDELLKGMERQKLAKARADFLVGKIELDARFKQDKDFETAEERYAEEIDKLRAKASEGLFGKALGTFDNQTEVDIAHGLSTRKVDVFGKRRDFNLAELAGNLDTTRDALLEARDSVTRTSLLAAAKESIKAMVDQGFMTELEGEKMGREYVEDFAVSHVQMQTPEERHRLLGIPEGWSPGDKLTPRRNDGTVVDFIPEDMRVKLARDAIPGVNARVAIDETDRIVAEGGSIEERITKARKISNPTVRDEVERRVKADYVFTEKVRAEELVEESQAESDRILDSGLGPKGMLDAARAIEDEDLRDATVKRVTARISADMTLDRERRRGLKHEAWTIVTEKQSTDALTPEMRAELDGLTLAAMNRYARTLQEGKEPVQDWDAWTEFTGLSAEVIADMDATDYQTKYRNKFDNIHYERGLALLRREKGAEATIARRMIEAENKQRSYTLADRVSNQVIDWKKLDKKKDAETISYIKNAMGAFVDRYVEKNEGRYPTRTELSKFAAGLVVEGEIKGSGWFWDDEGMRVEFIGTKEEGRFELLTEERDLPVISVATGISVADLPKVIKVIKDAGMSVTLRNIEAAKEFIR